MFNVIAKPNGWSKEVRSSQASNEGRTEGKQFNYNYWSSFISYMSNHPSKLFRTRSASYSHWMSIAIGKSSVHIDLLLNKREQTATVQLYMSDDFDKNLFDALSKYREEAEGKISEKLVWRRLDNKKASSVDLVRKFNLNDPAEQEVIFAWYKEYTEKFIAFFKPIIKKI